MKILVWIAFIMAGLVATEAPSAAQKTKESAKPVAPVSKTSEGLALSGYDPVAYFTSQKEQKGTAEYTHEYQGAKYRFASAENRDLFAKDPGKYAPQFGGYCAWAVGNGYTAPSSPDAWKIVDGKLYMNYNKDVQKKWEAQQSELIEKAGENWPKLHQ